MNIAIVGGSSGIGYETAKLFAGQGHNVISISRNLPENQVDGVDYITGDILHDEFTIPWDELHGFVYAPGSINLKPFNRLKREDFIKDFEINVYGAVNALQQVLPQLKKGKGSVILFSTVAVAQGMPYHSSTAASKGAVEGLARSLAAEWAPSVRVNVLAPSVTDTPMASRLVGTEERREASAQRHPLKDIGNPEDIAKVAASIIESPWISGQVIGIDGGMSTLRV